MSRRGGGRRSNVPRPEPELTVALVRDGVEVGCWALSDPGPGSGLRLVDELARTALAARRAGCAIRLRHAGGDLLDLLELLELLDVLGASEVFGQPEEREQLGVEEVVVPDDPAV